MSRRINDKNQTILKTLLKECGNNNCADCKTATHPRWASWNLGIFICIRCSGIHRSMGTHISRVKSVDLDTWTDEQVRSMVKWGNNKANIFWEAKFSGGSHVPDDSKIENFIRTKYDLKKWAASSTVPDPSTLSSTQTLTSPSSINPSQPQRTPKQENRRSLNNNLLDLEFGSPIAAPLKQQFLHPQQQSQSQPQQQQSQQQHHHHHPHYQQQQRQQQQSSKNDRPELKKSILSLYSTPLTTSNSTPNLPVHQQFTRSSTSSFNSTLNQNSLNGLNFNAAKNENSINNLNNQWNNSNQWSTTSTTNSSPTLNNNGLEDDLLKNVWK